MSRALARWIIRYAYAREVCREWGERAYPWNVRRAWSAAGAQIDLVLANPPRGFHVEDGFMRQHMDHCGHWLAGGECCVCRAGAAHVDHCDHWAASGTCCICRASGA